MKPLVVLLMLCALASCGIDGAPTPPGQVSQDQQDQAW